NPAPAVVDAKPEPADSARQEAGPPAPATAVASASGKAPATDGAAGAGASGKAFLHEEVVNSTGDPSTAANSLNGAVAWRFVENGDSGPAIEADLRVPERHLKITLSIHKNVDASLPASHLIEVKFDVPPDLPGKAIEKLTRIYMKPGADI